jgi:hypothetical protein
MSIVGGLDIHRKQITFDYLDTATGEVRRGQIAPADRAHLGVPEDRGTRAGLSVAFRPRSPRPPRWGPSEFPAGHLAGGPCPSWVMMYAPSRFRRNSGNGVLVTWPGGLPARRARRQWR